jgi:hypothetical protein
LICMQIMQCIGGKVVMILSVTIGRAPGALLLLLRLLVLVLAVELIVVVMSMVIQVLVIIGNAFEQQTSSHIASVCDIAKALLVAARVVACIDIYAETQCSIYWHSHRSFHSCTSQSIVSIA